MQVIEKKITVENATFQTLLENWMLLEKKGKLLEENITSTFLGDAYPYCKFASATSEPFDILYTHIGPRIKELYHEEMENRYVSELFDPWIRKTVIESYKECIDTQRPIFVSKGVSTIIGSIGYEYIILPFYKEAVFPQSFVTCLFPLGEDIKHSDDWMSALDQTPWFN